MNTRGRLIAGAVLLALAAGLIVLVTQVDLRAPAEEGDEAIPTPPDALFPEDASDVVTAIRVTDNETGETFAASTEDGETWMIDEAPEGTDTTLGADQARLAGAVIALPGVRPSRILSEIEALAPYGLDRAQYTLTFRLAGGNEHTLYVGSLNPTGSGYYVRLTEDVGTAAEVYVIPAYTLDQALAFVDDPPVVRPTPTAGPVEG